LPQYQPKKVFSGGKQGKAWNINPLIGYEMYATGKKSFGNSLKNA
jgi:hypothetical protein